MAGTIYVKKVAYKLRPDLADEGEEDDRYYLFAYDGEGAHFELFYADEPEREVGVASYFTPAEMKAGVLVPA